MRNTTPAYRLHGPNWSDPDVPQALQGKLARMTPSLGGVKPPTAVKTSRDGSPKSQKRRIAIFTLSQPFILTGMLAYRVSIR